MKKQIGIRKGQYGFCPSPVITLVFILLFSILVAPSATENALPCSFNSPQSMISADPPKLNLTYYTPTNRIETTVLSDSSIAGDHVILRAEWTVSVVNRSRLRVFAPAIPTSLSIEKDTNILEIDTRSLGNNATCLINSTAWLTNGSVISQVFQNVFIGNFFVPRVTVITPNGGEVWTGVNTIRWLGSDINTDETLHYDVRISSDSGLTFVTIASSLTQKWFDWNCSLYDKSDTYLVEIRVTDGIYFSSDRSNNPFTAGEIISNWTTTTTSTTTSNGTTLLDSRVAIFVAILVISSAVMALAVYYVARKWF
ncbi:MAG: hypothetical protein OEV85_12245 [Candidatus Thorarchaeota archaeon]|nr:hypothetical protein [Candidatus Thorarchaeota archaeon]